HLSAVLNRTVTKNQKDNRKEQDGYLFHIFSLKLYILLVLCYIFLLDTYNQKHSLVDFLPLCYRHPFVFLSLLGVFKRMDNGNSTRLYPLHPNQPFRYQRTSRSEPLIKCVKPLGIKFACNAYQLKQINNEC